MTWRSEGERPWSCLPLKGFSRFGSRNGFPFDSIVSGSCWKLRDEAAGAVSKFLLPTVFDFCPTRSFSRAFDKSFKSFRSTNGAAAVSSDFLLPLGGVPSVKSVTRLSPTGFAALFFFFVMPRILSLGAIGVSGTVLSRCERLGDLSPSRPQPDLVSSFCRVALTKKSKGLVRSNSRSSADEHDGLEISSLMGDDSGKFGTGTCSSGWGFCRFETMVMSQCRTALA